MKDHGITKLEYLYKILRVIKQETMPIDGHGDPAAIGDCWKEVFEIVDELTDIEAANNRHKQYMSEVLNSGDGVYRP